MSNSFNILAGNSDNILIEDDEILLFDDSQAEATVESNPNSSENWKVLIVDDEPSVHHATQLALKDFTFEGKGLHILSAYSSTTGKQLIAENLDIAFVLLDVVMESNDAGLQLVQHIREELQNPLVRIILRTGQPGDAPEESVILKYDINDYKLKVELTRQKLITTVISALRSYRDLKIIQQQSYQIQQTQLHLIQQEKMSIIGKLVAGIAHEVNNPVCFIEGNIQLALEYIKDLFSLLSLYEQEFQNKSPTIQARIDAIDLEYIRTDLPNLIASMHEGVNRISEISTSMRIFSRADSDCPIPFNLHDGIDSTISILKHRLKANEKRPEIQVVKNYGELPLVKCYAGQLNQVFMNILANAIDALEESNRDKNYQQIESFPNCITIFTKIDADKKFATIGIQDNGTGMSDELKSSIFACSFTTKQVGKGTGLGLAIARQIIVEKHGGLITVESTVGQGTTFIIHLPIKSV
ncbi:hybrid sensor histidine kinase/response regulator [Aetokthonos hydrillicola Thurmond2011]|jgi:signal transduction histidine kinase|uniref:histidine kinase n=1 Tax=Aetokthonos hydrillicola Thurmond2011 TaxID=2712845 RepID=A0AAP5IAH9_9CYAN|nr:hybrid sensor histidine kinase/response regulator [Aetokthonos hydrillicola]MBO3460713.1 response regulator [Aetokthonos hydrillicola CCALA 1050]MBW4587710.1 hybrid sensor histidine kinase/response regulator [Aetokthonos hydrillicola CCALA 1050]MDR9897908.1 hybrid sensor histidine kinase/response regulator [Aetokthonos hydrillicola Thurmond2011]